MDLSTRRRRYLGLLIGLHVAARLLTSGVLSALTLHQPGLLYELRSALFEWGWALSPLDASLPYLLALWAGFATGRWVLNFVRSLLLLIAVVSVPSLVRYGTGNGWLEWFWYLHPILVFEGAFVAIWLVGRRSGWRIVPVQMAPAEAHAPFGQNTFAVRDLFYLTTMVAITLAITLAALRTVQDPVGSASRMEVLLMLAFGFAKGCFLVPLAYLALRATDQRRSAILTLLGFLALLSVQLVVVFAVNSQMPPAVIWNTLFHNVRIFLGVGVSLWLVRLAGYRLVRE